MQRQPTRKSENGPSYVTAHWISRANVAPIAESKDFLIQLDIRRHEVHDLLASPFELAVTSKSCDGENLRLRETMSAARSTLLARK
jgi:hypothetical protein